MKNKIIKYLKNNGYFSIRTKSYSAIRKIKSILRYYLKLYKYNEELYLDSFVSNYPKIDAINLEKAKKIIYVFWTGDNKITENRKNGLKTLKEKAQVEVKLISSKNLPEYVLKDYPIHKAYKFLSLNHKSDYLRCYFMLHHGGGYADIKIYKKSWKKAFETLNSNDEKWAIGYREMGAWGVPDIEGRIGKDIKNHYYSLIGNATFIYKPNSPLAKEWMQEVHSRLDYYYEVLKENPATNPFGSNENYPIPWAHITGEIHQPLALKYHDRLLTSRDLLPSLKNYR